MTKSEAFKDWGTMNGFSDEKMEQYQIARDIHRKDIDDNPDDHEFAPRNIQQESRGYSKTRCKCGFGIYIDSSD